MNTTTQTPRHTRTVAELLTEVSHSPEVTVTYAWFQTMHSPGGDYGVGTIGDFATPAEAQQSREENPDLFNPESETEEIYFRYHLVKRTRTTNGREHEAV